MCLSSAALLPLSTLRIWRVVDYVRLVRSARGPSGSSTRRTRRVRADGPWADRIGYRFPSILHMGSDQADQLNPAEPDGFGAFLKAAFLSSLYGSDSASEIAAAVRIHAGW